MKKEQKTVKKTLPQKEERPSKLKEPVAPYKSLKLIPQLKNFSYFEFKKIADSTPFTQAEWAAILHLSERTLQRYAKSNSSFAAINAERAFQIEKVLKEGKLAFGTAQNFYAWLKRNPSMLEADLSLQSLTSLAGIEKVLTQLGRIQHGLFA